MIVWWIGIRYNLFIMQYLFGIIVLLTLVLADESTKFYKEKALIEGTDSTMRGMPYPSYFPFSNLTFQYYHNLFYSICQVGVTINIMFGHNIDTVFLVLWPIQIAAFLMTCVRKSILSSAGWHIYYTLSLLMNFIYGMTYSAQFKITYPIGYWIFFGGICILRFKYNKYALWIGTVSLHWLLITFKLPSYMPRTIPLKIT